jgi:hypothetical protein
MSRRSLSSIALLTVFFAGFAPTSSCSDLSEMWLLLSSYEDVRIDADELAYFLAIHGYDADPIDHYVIVNLPGGETAFITPNGAAPGLGDLWKTPPPPPKPTGPVRSIPEDAIIKDPLYHKTPESSQVERLTKERFIFPVTPLGMCYDGSRRLATSYSGFGYNVMYMYDPSEWDWQGHLWVVVETTDFPDRWLAVDSYYGIMKVDDYYEAPWSFDDMKYLDYINPRWRLM